MTTLWRKWRALAGQDRRLLAETALLVLRVRAGLRLGSFAALRRRLDAAPASPGSAPPGLERVAWAVAAVARRVPGTTCLAESLVAHTLLRRRGFSPVLHIGVRAHAGAAVPLDAHAWVECEGRVVAGDVDDLGEYARLRPVRPPSPVASDRP